MKNSDPRSSGQARLGTGKRREAKRDIEARTLARIRTAAAIVRYRQETLYDRLADRFRLAFEEGVDKSREAMDIAAGKAGDHLVAAGALTPEQGDRLKGFLLRDLDRTAVASSASGRARKRRPPAGKAEPDALASITQVLESLGEGVRGIAAGAPPEPLYRTGEVTISGTLTCLNCKADLHFKTTGTVPPCPGCSGAKFRIG